MADLPITVHEGEGFATPESMQWRTAREDGPFRTCGYCGSMHPEDFASAEVASSGRLELADQKYGWPHKAYIDVANPEPDRLYCIGSATVADDTYKPWADLTPEERAAVESAGHADGDPAAADRFGRIPGYLIGTRSSLHAKFYTVHLLEPGLDPEVADRCFARIGLVIEPGDKPGSVRWRRYDYGQGTVA